MRSHTTVIGEKPLVRAVFVAMKLTPQNSTAPPRQSKAIAGESAKRGLMAVLLSQTVRVLLFRWRRSPRGAIATAEAL